ncbi:hypothetical protein BH09BAC3_BH09BAC3_35220 [soil metagenome]
MSRQCTHTKLSALSLLAFVVLYGCSPTPGGPEYMSKIRNVKNGLHVVHQLDDFVFDVQGQPSELVWTQRHGSFDAGLFENEKSDLDQIFYCTLNINARIDGKGVIQHIAKDDKAQIKALSYYFSYRFQDNVYVTANGVKWPCVLYHYEQYGKQTFVLGFEKPKDIEKEVILHIDSDILSDKPIEIKVSTRL